MARQRREKWTCISGIVLIALCALLVISLARGSQPAGKFNEGLTGAPDGSSGCWPGCCPWSAVYWGWKLIVGGPYRRVTFFTAWVVLGFLTLSTLSPR